MKERKVYMIEVKNVKKKFIKWNEKKQKTEFYANKGISLEAHDGEIVGILGPNGAGKTTLLRMIAGILNPTEGEIFFDKKNYQENEIEIKMNLAYLSGNTKLYDTLTTYELLYMCCEIYKMKKETIDKKIKEISKKLNLDSFLYQKIGQLSTGQTQRVNIARCFIHDPKYYVFDEATTGLDIISSQIILDFMKEEKKKGKTILYSTHYMEEAENICDRVIMIHEGEVLLSGTPEEIKMNTKTTNLRDAFFTLIGGEIDEK